MASFDAGAAYLDGDFSHGYYAHLLQGDMVGVVNERGDVIVEESIDCDLDALRKTRMQDIAAKRLLIEGIEKARAEREAQREDEAGPKFIIHVVVNGLDLTMNEDRPMTRRMRDNILQALAGTDGAISLPIPDDDEAMYVVPIRKIDYVAVLEKKQPKERTGW